jgi:hypothetical protein
MKENREKKRARLLAKASQVIDEYLAWEEKNPRPDLMQIEEGVWARDSPASD